MLSSVSVTRFCSLHVDMLSSRKTSQLENKNPEFISLKIKWYLCANIRYMVKFCENDTFKNPVCMALILKKKMCVVEYMKVKQKKACAHIS